MEKGQKWQEFLKELANLYFFWFFGVLFFASFRIIFIVIYNDQINGCLPFYEYLKTFLAGLKFDSTALCYFMILPLLSLLSLSRFGYYKIIKKIRQVHQVLFVVLSTLICVITLNYFGEYHDQFNNFLFLALYDDQKAVLKTIFKDYHPFLNLVCFSITLLISFFILSYFESKTKLYNWLCQLKFKRYKIVIVCFSILLFFFAIRGSFTGTPAVRRYACVSKDEFLNKTVVNPFRSLKYALEDFSALNLVHCVNPFLNKKEFTKKYSQNLVSDVLKKNANGPQIEKPKQIFLVVMESYDSWPLQEKYKSLGVATNLKEIASEGTHFTHFLPSSTTTFNSFAAVVTNLPYCGVNISDIGALNEPFQTSMFRQFKKLGYEINFFYGGYLSWEEIGEFVKYHGADNLYSGADAGGEPDSGDWGVEDEDLFSLVVRNTDTKKYSLNIILTTSYHPPYIIDLKEKGFRYESIEDLPKESLKYFKEGMTLTELGNLWYGDQAIGGFMKTAKDKYRDGLFCFTGDHFGRRFINHHPNLYENSSVPFIMYGKSIPKTVNTTPGSHIDIMPTLIEMIAPKNFTYYSFGNSLLNGKKNTAYGFEKMIYGNELFYFPKDKKVKRIGLDDLKECKTDTFSYLQDYNNIMALAWHYTMKGNDLKKDKIEKK